MIEVLPAAADRFGDVASILSPGNPGSDACWRLSYRLPHREFAALAGADRPARLRRFAEEVVPLVRAEVETDLWGPADARRAKGFTAR